MSAGCFHPNPLVHGGSSQDMRLVPALQPDAAPVDGRAMDELILFLSKYSRLLNYYNTENKISGNWQAFIANDLSTLLASISATPYNDCLAVYYKYFNKIQSESGLSNLKNYIKILFDISFTLVDKIRAWDEILVLKTPAKEMLYQEISSRLAYDLRDLLQYYVAAKPLYVNSTFIVQPGTEDYQPDNTEDILQHEFRQAWWAKFNPADIIANWLDYKNVYLPAHPLTKNIFNVSTLTGTDNIQYSSSYLHKTFTNIYNAYTRIINAVKQYFLESITSYPFHQAHNGIILSFLKLFKVSQKELNLLTGRHLDFYYTDVLRINRKPPVPDAAHIVFTLAKNVQPYTVEKGTELLGGKDKNGKELIYPITESITVNTSEVGALKSIFFDDNITSGGIYAAEVSNSSDGKGKELKPEDPSWFAFGSSQPIMEDARTMAKADAGFIIAAPVLQLNEGVRTITIDINVDNFGGETFLENELAGNLEIALTGEKDWITHPLISTSDTNQPDAIKINTAGNKITIKLTLDENTEAVVPFDSAVHKAGYNTTWPAIRCLLKKTADNVPLYRKLSSITVTGFYIAVSVQKAFSCILHNDQGGIDPKNPFTPFGSQPKKGTSFYFGSPEVFSKKLTSLTLHLKWMNLPEGYTMWGYYTYYYANNPYNYIGLPNDNTHAFTIAKQVTGNPAVLSDHLFGFVNNIAINEANSSQDLVFSSLFSDSQADMEPFNEYSPSLRRGFLKLTLTGPANAFGHGVFTKVYTDQVIAVNKLNSYNTTPREPYIPLLKPLTYSYTADETIAVGDSADKMKGQFFHVFPFGYAEKNDGSSIRVVSPFTHTKKENTTYQLQGAMYIGIKNIQPKQVLNLYIEFSEGSEDTSLDPPGIGWSYLAGNEWKLLNDFILADDTNGFLGSGIVKITIPEDMNDDNTAMPAGLRWIKAGVKDLYAAYPKVYAVYTNAVKATFENKDNDTSHLAEHLKAGTISKLVNSVAEIKKIEQPYDSFDGKMQEQDQPYYTRVSERLRHKNRAITIWDYERLVLEQFSYLYKTKCLNHTNDETETAPGCVRMIVIPDMSRKSTGNLYQPKISNNKRRLIRDYLRSLNCPFADLQVQNPQYEAIKVKCQVKIRKGLDEIAYIEQLKKDINKFLAPWAFDESHGIDFGGSMHRSQIIYYMEKLSYVDFVTDFVMDVFIGNTIITNKDEVKASTSKSILTTSTTHEIGTNVCAT